MTIDEFFEKLLLEVKSSPPVEFLGKGFSTPTGDYRNSIDYDDVYYLPIFHAISQIFSNSILVEYNPEFGVEASLCHPIQSHLIYFRDHLAPYILSTNLKRNVNSCKFYEISKDPYDILEIFKNFQIAIIGKIEKKDFLPVVQSLWGGLVDGGVLIFRKSFEMEKEILKWAEGKNGRSIPTSSGMMVFFKGY